MPEIHLEGHKVMLQLVEQHPPVCIETDTGIQSMKMSLQQIAIGKNWRAKKRTEGDLRVCFAIETILVLGSPSLHFGYQVSFVQLLKCYEMF